MYLVNANEKDYGSAIRGLNSQKVLNSDQFQETIIEGNNVLSTHRFDHIKRTSPHNKGNSHHQNKRKRKHKDENKDDTGPALTFVQLRGKCYCCGNAKYKFPQYMKDKISREE